MWLNPCEICITIPFEDVYLNFYLHTKLLSCIRTVENEVCHICRLLIRKLIDDEASVQRILTKAKTKS